jgi:GNAT superfamily N-acetyltransferase
MTPPRPAPDAAAGIIRAGHADAGVLSQVIADAFFPLAPCEWLIPDETARREIFPSYFRMHVEHVIADGIVHTTPARDAAALWIPLGTKPPAPPDGYHEHLSRITGRWADRFTAFDAELDTHHLAGTAHHHLAILAVSPAAQGHGTATALLQAHHAVLDELSMTAYLEASDLRTRSIYVRHGYRDYGIPIRLNDGLLPGSDHHASAQPDGGVRMYPMLRHPGPGTSGAASGNAR